MNVNSFTQSLTSENKYSLLLGDIEKAGLLTKSPIPYLPYFLLIGSGIIFGLWILTRTDHLIVIILDAVFLGIVFAQSAFLGHDIAHKVFQV